MKLDDLVRGHVRDTLIAHRGHIVSTANELGLHPRTLLRKLQSDPELKRALLSLRKAEIEAELKAVGS